MEVDKLLKLDERIGRRVNAVRPRVAGYGHDDVIAPGLEPEEGLGPQKAEPADLLAADDALEQEGRRTPLDPAEGRDGCQAIPGQLAVNWDAGSGPGPAGDFLERVGIAGHRGLVWQVRSTRRDRRDPPRTLPPRQPGR